MFPLQTIDAWWVTCLHLPYKQIQSAPFNANISAYTFNICQYLPGFIVRLPIRPVVANHLAMFVESTANITGRRVAVASSRCHNCIFQVLSRGSQKPVDVPSKILHLWRVFKLKNIFEDDKIYNIVSVLPMSKCTGLAALYTCTHMYMCVCACVRNWIFEKLEHALGHTQALASEQPNPKPQWLFILRRKS